MTRYFRRFVRLKIVNTVVFFGPRELGGSSAAVGVNINDRSLISQEGAICDRSLLFARSPLSVLRTIDNAGSALELGQTLGNRSLNPVVICGGGFN